MLKERQHVAPVVRLDRDDLLIMHHRKVDGLVRADDVADHRRRPGAGLRLLLRADDRDGHRKPSGLRHDLGLARNVIVVVVAARVGLSVDLTDADVSHVVLQPVKPVKYVTFKTRWKQGYLEVS